MSVGAFQFLHADQIQLDAQWKLAGEFADEERVLLQDATLNAFDQLIATAIDRNVHFVLLTGQLFAPEGPTLRSLVRFKDGLECLQEEGIEAIIVPTGKDLEVLRKTTWLATNNLNDLSPWDRHPAVVQCRNQLTVSVASLNSSHEGIRRVDPPQSMVSSQRDASGAFQIGICQTNDQSSLVEADEALSQQSFDYLAISGSHIQREFLAPQLTGHAPGVLQPLEKSEHGSSGAVFVKVDQFGTPQTSLIPTSAVGHSSHRIHVGPNADWEQLVQEMQDVLQTHRIEQSQQLHIVDWDVHASGELEQSLHDATFRAEIIDFLNEDLSASSSCRVHHELHWQHNDYHRRPQSELEQDLQQLSAEIPNQDFNHRMDTTVSRLDELGAWSERGPRRLDQQMDRKTILEAAERIGLESLAKAAAET